jgi:hypothetical protein
MEITLLRIMILTMMLTLSCSLSAETVVTTYVTKVQEERQTTRWTLTEWLRIKERMKMMDVWLAMFSNPEKDKFRPELNISYGVTKGRGTFTDAAGVTEEAATSGRAGRAQQWVTNIVKGPAGVRTLNIDFGLEGYQRDSGSFEPAVATGATTTTPAADASTRAVGTTYYTADLRLFGKNIQDSSLVLKYGQYQSRNTLPTDAGAVPGFRGVVAGAELQLYVFKWLGLEGNYLAYGGASRLADDSQRAGTYHDYLGYVEISLLRLMIGRYHEDWTLAQDAGETGEASRASEDGLLAGMKLQF